MAVSTFNYQSQRAQLARFEVQLQKRVVKAVFVLASAGLIVAGFGLLLAGISFGWLVFTLAIWPLAVLLWQERYLVHLPPADGGSLNDRIEVGLLGQLPRNLTMQALIDKLALARSTQFMMIRSGLSPNLLSNVNQQSPLNLEDIWRSTLAQYPSGVIKGSMLLAGVIKSSPNLVQLLPHLQLDESDLPKVVAWYDRLEMLIAEHAKPRKTGGIARDWTFGYTPLLSRFGVNISERVTRGGLINVDLESHREALDFLTTTFSSGGKQNVALIGPLGAGKTSIVHAFAEQLLASDSKLPTDLKFRQVISLDASSLISAASGRGELEDLLNRLLVEAYKAKNIILCLDDAQLFFEEGVGSVDLSNLLQPILEGGGLRIILTMDEQRYLQIAARNPSLAASLNRTMVKPARLDETLAILQDQLISIEFQHKVTYMYQALKESYRLSERYLYDQAQPGKALKALTGAASFAENGLVTAASVQRAIEQTQGVKVAATSNDSDRQKLLNLEQLIHERMINQTRAVTVVSDALRRARAGVRSESKPIGTFMFLGPTGVGKTELAKSLAEVYFGGEGHLIRLDMNEFVSADDVKRLIADGADDPHSLSAQIMKQPFSVILLDEVEKAHDSVLTTLLQVLDEGILRDIKGREVSFRDAIIIATSNAGAEQIRHHIEAGEQLEQFEDAFVDNLISSREFRPEFLNRFDEIVLFRPLNELELGQVIDLIIAGVNKTLEPQKVGLKINVELKAWLIKNGNDPRLGARPMRRIVQRVVENTMAKRMLSGEVQPGQIVELTLDDVANIPTKTPQQQG